MWKLLLSVLAVLRLSVDDEEDKEDPFPLHSARLCMSEIV